MTKEEVVVLDTLEEDEAYLFAILSDPSGLDQAEFLWYDPSTEDHKFCSHCGTSANGVHLHEHDELAPEEWVPKYNTPSGCFRAWPYQWPWWRAEGNLHIDQCARSVGKSLSIMVRACAFPFLFPGQEMVITAPELVHLEPIVSLIESRMNSTRALSEMLPKGKSAVTHRPFQMNFLNGARIIGRIPQRDGKGVKGLHPIWLEQDECLAAGTVVLTKRGMVAIEDVVVGDEVWTHLGRWRRVTAIFDRGVRPTVNVRGQGWPRLQCTSTHPLWAKQVTRWRDPRKWRPVLSDPGWWPVEECEDAYWASPRCPAGVALPPPVIPRAPVGPSYDIEWRQPEFLWMLGLFLAEGSLSSSCETGGKLNRCYWSVHTDEVDDVLRFAKAAGLNPRVQSVQGSANCKNVLVTHQGLAAWLAQHVGRGARHKSIPVWAYSLPEELRRSLLAGIVYGDGFMDPDSRYEAGRWKVSTTSRALAVGLRILAQGLGYHVSTYVIDHRKNVSVIREREVTSGTWYQVVANVNGQGHDDGAHRWTRIRRLEEGEPLHVFDLEVEDDHSFVADGVVVHNSQDYPHAGWVELQQTLKRGFTGATWRAHGVTKGVRDDFYQFTQDSPDNPWKVHRIAAMWRPNWTDAEREQAVQQYGSREDPDYRRNILGLHGDKTNPIFVLTQLMRNVDAEPTSSYNQAEYFKVSVKKEQLELWEQEVLDVLDFPAGHLSYAGRSPAERMNHPQATYWAGMDIGYCADAETEILTRRGWLRSDEVEVGDETLGINPATGQSEWQRIDLVFREHRDQVPMVSMEGQSFSALTTPHHRWLVEHDSSKGRRWRWTTSATMNTRDLVPLAAPCADLPEEAVFTDEFVELMAWFWTEGFAFNTGFGTCQSYRANAGLVSRIDRCLEKEYGPSGPLLMGPRSVNFADHPYLWSRTERPEMGMVYYYLPREIAAPFWEWAPNKVPSMRFLLSLTRAQLDLFIDTSICADGWVDCHGASKAELWDYRHTSMLEAACALAGRPTSTNPIHGDRSAGRAHHTSLLKCDRAYVMRAASFPRTSSKAMTVETLEYTGVIWCPSVRHRNWLARRRGAVYYTGNTIDPSEVLVFVEHRRKATEPTQFKLLTRISMTRMPHRQQIMAILHTIDFYRPRAFAMDKAGNGLPLFQEMQEHVEAFRRQDWEHVPTWMRRYDLDYALNTIKGYNFSEKLVVDFDKSVEVSPYADQADVVAQSGMRRNAKEYGTDLLREWVDAQRLWLPWDEDLLKQFQGGTWASNRSMDAYGRRVFSRGNDHVLDAARMFALGQAQYSIEEMLREEKDSAPVYDTFFAL